MDMSFFKLIFSDCGGLGSALHNRQEIKIFSLNQIKLFCAGGVDRKLVTRVSAYLIVLATLVTEEREAGEAGEGG